MKKIIKLLLLIVLVFSVTSSVFAQSVTFKMKRPPLNQLKAADLWSATITNSGEAFTAYLYGSMTNNENGELIANGQTMTFEVKRGTTNFKVSDLPKVPDVNYLSKDPKYKQSFMNTGGAPPGDYKICVELRYANNTVAGEDCFDQKITGGDAPQLISPRNEEELNNDNPIFTWMHMKGPGSNQTYTLRIVEIKDDESPENAMLKNKAFFEKEGISQTLLQYPTSAPKFEEGKKYAWQISIGTINSGVQVFSLITGVHLDAEVDSLKCTGKPCEFTFKITVFNRSNNFFNGIIQTLNVITPSGATIISMSPALTQTLNINTNKVFTGTVKFANCPVVPPVEFEVKILRTGTSTLYPVSGFTPGILNNCCTPPPANMVGWWTFDEATGTIANDISGFNNVGTYVSTPSVINPGKVANALNFTAGKYVTVQNHADVNFGPSENFSIDCWIKNKNSGLRTILDKRENACNNLTASLGYCMFLSNGKLGFQIGNGGAMNNYVASVGNNIADDKWHLVAITFDRGGNCGSTGTLRFYVDGSLVGSPFINVPAGNLITNMNLFIGERQTAFGSNPFEGSIDELEIFKRVLTPAEILAIYNADSAGKCKK